MREYRLDESEKDSNQYYLIPLGEKSVSHAIYFDDPQKAHQFRLALGLGTHPDPDKSPSSYKRRNGFHHGAIIYEAVAELNAPQDEYDSGCCQSGCPGCPWTLEQIRLGKL